MSETGLLGRMHSRLSDWCQRSSLPLLNHILLRARVGDVDIHLWPASPTVSYVRSWPDPAARRGEDQSPLLGKSFRLTSRWSASTPGEIRCPDMRFSRPAAET